jgi:hypothetical protein
VFGEIIPQAMCGRNPLWTGYWTLPITMIFYCVLSPGAYPVSKLLDYLLGEEVGVFYLRDELAELLKLTQKHSDLDRDELGILSGALSLKNTCIEEVNARPVPPLLLLLLLPLPPPPTLPFLTQTTTTTTTTTTATTAIATTMHHSNSNHVLQSYSFPRTHTRTGDVPNFRRLHGGGKH